MAELINGLRSLPIELHRDQPGMTGANVRLQAAREAAQAAMLDSHVALLLAEFELILAAGRRMDDLGCCRARCRNRAGIASNDRAWRDARSLERNIRLAHGRRSKMRAEAVVQADADRAALINETRRRARGQAARAEELPTSRCARRGTAGHRPPKMVERWPCCTT